MTPDRRAERLNARRHLRLMDAAKRDLLEREFAEAGEAALRIVNEPISAEIRAKAEREWGES